MKVFVKQFLIAFVILTVLLTPVQFMLHRVSETRIFSGEENLMDDMNVLVDPNSPFFEAFQDSQRVNILVLGVNDGMTDTIMLGSYDLKNQHVDVISVPRDTYCPRPGAKSPAAKKINAIYHSNNGGGAVGTATAVSSVLMGMPIHYYAVIDYKGVGNIVDSLGGIPMNIPFHMKYDDPYDKPPLHINIPEGQQTLNRDTAIQFLRFRHANPGSGYKSYPEGDIGRIKAQQEFMKSAFRQALGFNLPNVAKTVIQNVDSDVDIGIALKIATNAMSLSKENIQTYLTPGYPKTVDGASYWFADDEKVRDMIEEIYAVSDETTDAAI
ncbi:MAG: LCP family protein, partial [Anaerovorax sp.]|nr:LCP family protein [Anaerovorax sp.]